VQNVKYESGMLDMKGAEVRDRAEDAFRKHL